jgi:hypothetical protein
MATTAFVEAEINAPKKVYMDTRFSQAGTTTTELCQGIIDVPSFTSVTLVASGLSGPNSHAIDYGQLSPCSYNYRIIFEDLSTFDGTGTVGTGVQTKAIITGTVPIKKILIRIGVTSTGGTGHYGIRVNSETGNKYYQLSSLYDPLSPTNRLLTWFGFNIGDYMNIVLEAR